MERGARRLKHRIDVLDIGRHDAHRWYLGQTSHIAPRPSTSRTESEVSNAGRSSTRFTDLSCRWIDPIWAASGNCIHSSSIILMYLSCVFLLFIALCLSSFIPQPRFPPTLDASQSRFSQGGGRRQWDAFCVAAVAALADLFLNPEFSRISTDEYGVSKVWGETCSPLVSFQFIMAKPVPWLLRLGILFFNWVDHFSPFAGKTDFKLDGLAENTGKKDSLVCIWRKTDATSRSTVLAPSP